MMSQPGAGTVLKYGQRLSPWAGTWVGWSCQEGGLNQLTEMQDQALGATFCSEIFSVGMVVGSRQMGFSSLCMGKLEGPTKHSHYLSLEQFKQ